MLLDNMWMTDNRTKQKKKWSYNEVVCNESCEEVNDSHEEKILKR